MALRQIEYGDVTLTAAAFEVADTGRFLVALSIASVSGGCDRRYSQFLDPLSEDGLFDSVDEALESAILFGRAIVDGDVLGRDSEYLRSGSRMM
jgi:hypothetical protein